MCKISIWFCFIMFPLLVNGQLLMNDYTSPAIEHHKKLQQATYSQPPSHKGTKTTASAIFDTTRWNHIIDSTWGAGIDDTAKLSMFNRIWASFDSIYPCYVHLPLYNWDSIVNDMRTKISNGISKGRFAGMLNRLRRYINDAHTNMYDWRVIYPTSIYPGLPLFRDESGKFGACITMLEDSTAMVYDAIPGHPFGLQPGDIILGYNGLPWKDLVQIILQYQMPASVYIGSTDAATYHKYIKAAGENWYLFDTINIKKCNGNIVSFPTSYMSPTNYSDLCTEQLPLQGVSRLTYNQFYNQNKSISHGVLAGTRIGYLYMLDCSDPTGDEMYNAVKNLVEDSLVTGLIIDIRTNYGGGFGAYLKTFKYLMHGDISWVGYGERVTYNNRYLMFNQPSSWYDITDNDPHSTNMPIALLCGPEAVSAGDIFQLMYTHHPFVRTFGKSTAGAYGSTKQIPTGQPDYYAITQPVNFYEVINPTHYLSHTEYPVDQPVWFDRDSVCAGKDNIVSTAVQWIHQKLDIPTTMNNGQNRVDIFPNPVIGMLNIMIRSTYSEDIRMVITNIYGVTIGEYTQTIRPGNNEVRLDFDDMNLPGGNYILSVESVNTGRTAKKFTYLK